MWTAVTLADLWGVDVATIEDLCRRGRLHGRVVDGDWHISTEAVDAFLQTRQPQGPRRPSTGHAAQLLRLA